MATIRISAKCSDLCYSEIINDDRNLVAENDGYVPENIGIGGGDFVELEIDLQTGKVLNWKPVMLDMALSAVKLA